MNKLLLIILSIVLFSFSNYSADNIYKGLKSILYDGKKALNKEALVHANFLSVDFAKKLITIADWKGLEAVIHFTDTQIDLIKKFRTFTYYKFNFKVTKVERIPSEPARVEGKIEGMLIKIIKK